MLLLTLLLLFDDKKLTYHKQDVLSIVQNTGMLYFQQTFYIILRDIGSRNL